MKKRVCSAFSLICAGALLLDVCAGQPIETVQTAEVGTYDNLDLSIDPNLLAGISSAVSVNMETLAASVETSDSVITAASLGALYGYSNIGICNVESGNLNVRETASTDGKLIGKFPKNGACEILDSDGDWYLIQSGEITGYVLAEYIVTGNDAWSMATELAQFVATAKTGGLRVRLEPNTECEILAQLADGEEVTVLEELGDWVRVEVDGEEGYVAAEYVDVELSLNTAMTLAQARYGAEVSEVRASLCDYALQFVGNPYVWGGTSLTRGADCSGFVMQIYAKYGISLPHSSRAQANYGRKVSTSELQPGDLIFYGSGSYINHVAIYIGGGQICHASNKRTGIKVSNAFYRSPIKCVRLFTE